MTTLQQKDIFELVNDSVMTRTMEGIIQFWNHSSEDLYGWRKEEAIGRVSHNLLKTQFPKPLEEIESELVRNGRWQGKLVHTTRDGGRVVVESRWSLELKEQIGTLVEINTRSTGPVAPTGEAATEREETRNLGEQTVATLQEEDIFELVNDSVMTRTMEGIIKFWNHSSEDLYGWRKEEAIGRVSHNLLETQFPKPLEEIESELVRNGRWQGKLVHTTRDGGRVVVESRWSLELKEQIGTLVEINTRSTDYEIYAGAGTDSSGVESGKQEPLPARKPGRVDDFLRKIANIVLGGGGIFSLLLFLGVFYYYGWSGQRSFASPAGQFIYFALPGLLALTFFMSLRLPASQKINIALCFGSIALTAYALEGTMALWSRLPSVRVSQYRQSLIAAAKALGVKYDSRTKAEVIDDFQKRGIDAVPSIYPGELLTEHRDGTMKSAVTINSVEVLPLASMAEKLTVVCNESGEFLTYTSDTHGFNNPPSVWSTAIDIVAVGDSFTQGWCVPSDKNFVSVIRRRYPGTLNLGIGGNGPLVMLGTIKEYAEIVKPKVVLWFYFEGNDLGELSNERKNPILRQYLINDEFSQGLFNRQAEIDRALAAYRESVPKTSWSIKLEEIAESIKKTDTLPQRLENIAKLTELRERLGVVYGTAAASPPDETAGPRRKDVPQIDLLFDVLLQAKKSAGQWGGNVYFVYLPARTRYAPAEGIDVNRRAVLNVVNKAGLPVIDMHPTFMAHKDPLSLFPLRLAAHYDEEGHRLVAQEVLRSISVNK